MKANFWLMRSGKPGPQTWSKGRTGTKVNDGVIKLVYISNLIKCWAVIGERILGRSGPFSQIHATYMFMILQHEWRVSA